MKIRKTIQELRDEYFELTGSYPCAAGYGLCSSKDSVADMVKSEKNKKHIK